MMMIPSSYEVGNVMELFLALCYGLTGWYLPRHFLRLAWDGIVHKDLSAVYQTVAVAGGEHTNNNSNNDQDGVVVVVDFLLNQPLVDPPTIPAAFLTQTCVYLPLVLTLLLTWRLHGNNCNKYNKDNGVAAALPQQQHRTVTRAAAMRATACAWAASVGTSEGLTQILKLYVQRRRPNFCALCRFRHGVCTAADPADVVEANLSFPSGHSSLSACGMTFWTFTTVSLLLSSSSSSSSSIPRHVRRWSSAAVALTALAYTLLVGTSRIVDQWHHPSDVLAGWLLGGLSALGACLVWFPPPWHPSAGIPWTVLMGQDNSSSMMGLSLSSGNLLLPRTSSVSAKEQSSFHE